MSAHDNLTTQEKFGKAVNSGKLDVLRDLIAPDVLDHNPAPDQGPGPDGFIQMFSAMRGSFPDLTVTVDQLVTDEDKVAIAYTITGTQRGDFLGVSPTNHKISARGVQIGRFKNGKLVERWGSSDQLGILQQIGATPRKAA